MVSAAANAETGPSRTFVIAIDQAPPALILTAAMKGQLPSPLQATVDRGAVGFMTTKGLSLTNRRESYAAIGLGAPAAIRERAGSTARQLPVDGDAIAPASGANAVPPDFRNLKEGILNPDASRRALWKTGWASLGETLKERGVEVWLLGAADLAGAERREHSLIVADARGFIPKGSLLPIFDVPISDPNPSSAPSLNFLETLGGLPRKDLFVLIVFPDFLMIQSEPAFMQPAERRTRLERRALARLNVLTASVLNVMRPSDRLALISPLAESRSWRGRSSLLGLTVFYGPGIPSGVLWSPSVRRNALVSNLDLAPTFASWHGAPAAPAWPGSVVRPRTDDRPAQNALKEYERLNFLFDQRAVAVRRFIVFNIAFLLAAVPVLALSRRTGRLKPLFSAGGRILAAVCFGLACMGLAPVRTFPSLFLSIAAAAVLFIAWTAAFEAGVRRVAAGAGLFAAALLADQFAGQPLAKNSLLSYLPQYGARYYGIGNEFSGLLTGCAVLFLSAVPTLVKNPVRAAAVIVGFSAFVFIGILHPALGSNLGGGVGAGSGLGLLCVFALRDRLNPRISAVVLIVAALAAGGLFFEAQKRADPERSHLTRIVRQVEREGGARPVIEMAARKLQTNWRLIRNTDWTWLLGLAALNLWLLRPALKRSRDGGLDFHGAPRGIAALFVAAAANLAANDSGVVAAAFTLLPPVYLLLDVSGPPSGPDV